MSELNIAPCFPFRRIKITGQLVSAEAAEAYIHKELTVWIEKVGHRKDVYRYGEHAWARDGKKTRRPSHAA